MKNYLVIQLARFGDLIQTKRLLATLCARENAVVHLCIDKSLRQLARLVYPEVQLHTITAHGSGVHQADVVRAMLIDNRSTFAELQSLEFETIYNLNYSPLNFRVAALFDPERVEGYGWSNGQELIGLWPSMAMRWSNHRRTSINLVDFWAGYCPDMIAPEQVNPEAVSRGSDIGVVLAGRESRRSLPVETLASLLTVTAKKHSEGRILLLGSQSEEGVGYAVMKNLPADIQARTSNLAGKTNWADLVEVVGSLDHIITPDTGTMHLAAHLGTRVRAYFLSSAWCFETGPYGLGHTVYQAMTDCLPCLETQPCHYDVKCLNTFNRPEFLRLLVTGNAAHAPDGLMVLTSSFDRLGQTYTSLAGEDFHYRLRLHFREFIRQYLAGDGGPISEDESVFTERVYREIDWLLPERLASNIG